MSVRGPEWRIHFYSFIARLYFYVPALLLHVEHQLRGAGVQNARAYSLSVLALLSVGMLAAEYPSGVLADWMGRKRTLMLAGLVQALGLLLFLVPESLLAICAAQLMIGVATAFRSGADSALLHAQLERVGEAERYGGALARMRFFNVSAIALASASGGLLYAWEPRSVFVLAAAASVLGLLPLRRVAEPARNAHHRRSYRDVVHESLGELRHNRAAATLTFLGGVGNPYFVLAFWVTQTHLLDLELPLEWIGLTVASMSALQALTMPLSGWLTARLSRLSRAVPVLLLAPSIAFLCVQPSLVLSHPELGTALLVVASGCHVLYRNAINVRLQALVPDSVRSSIVSLEALVGSLFYMLLFPLSGWLLSTLDQGRGFTVIGGLALLTITWPLLRAFRSGALTTRV